MGNNFLMKGGELYETDWKEEGGEKDNGGKGLCELLPKLRVLQKAEVYFK